MKRIFSISMLSCMIIIIMLSPNKLIKANETDESKKIIENNRYSYVNCANCSVSITSGTAKICSLVEGANGTTSTSVTVYLEKLVNGSWQTYTSWSHSGCRNQNNTDSVNVTSGAYRVWMSVTASGTGGSESFNVDGNVAGC